MACALEEFLRRGDLDEILNDEFHFYSFSWTVFDFPLRAAIIQATRVESNASTRYKLGNPNVLASIWAIGRINEMGTFKSSVRRL